MGEGFRNIRAVAFCAADLPGAFREGCLRLLTGCAQQPVPSSRSAREIGGAFGRSRKLSPAAGRLAREFATPCKANVKIAGALDDNQIIAMDEFLITRVSKDVFDT